MVNREATKVKPAVFNSNMEDVRENENKRLQIKLLRIVASDFLCWMPVCFMAFIHFGGGKNENMDFKTKLHSNFFKHNKIPLFFFQP